ncbi:MAG: ABC transporter ATP-binding protein, partial [Nocardioides sp.]|uniref:ABC transporter ATP-binding protein n=1 Tax=Nocardioides sp. TaxID=35761 RepID=UPI0039E5D72C
MTGPTSPVLDVSGLRVQAPRGRLIVEDVALSVSRGEVLAVVGESGSGKTTTALALLGATRGGARIVGGRIDVAGADMAVLPERERRLLRGRRISYVPQDPATQLNPAHRIGRQLGESLALVGRDSEERRLALLTRVGLPADQAFLRRFPFELSGGQQQRVAIAMALAGTPDVVVLDEPTTGLDVTTQQRIIGLVRRLADAGDAAFVHITHDLALVSHLADRVAVMYRGRIVESGSTADVLRRPRHPFTRVLVASAPGPRGVHVVTDARGDAVDVEAEQSSVRELEGLRVAPLPPPRPPAEPRPLLEV